MNLTSKQCPGMRVSLSKQGVRVSKTRKAKGSVRTWEEQISQTPNMFVFQLSLKSKRCKMVPACISGRDSICHQKQVQFWSLGVCVRLPLMLVLCASISISHNFIRARCYGCPVYFQSHGNFIITLNHNPVRSATGEGEGVWVIQGKTRRFF